MRKWIIILLLLISRAYAQYPNPLPSSGSLSIQEIADWMYAAGEISGSDLTNNKSLQFLKSRSHLSDKSAPYRISDWYGYAADPNAVAYITPFPDANLIGFNVQAGIYVNSPPYYPDQTITIYYEYGTSYGNYGYGSIDLTAGNWYVFASPPWSSGERFVEIYISYVSPGADGRRTFYTMAYIE